MNHQINRLLNFALQKGMIGTDDLYYAANLILDLLQLDEFELEEIDEKLETAQDIIDHILDYAVEKGMISDSVTEKDLFDTRLMNCLMPRPSEVVNKFNILYNESPEKATDYFYDLSISSNYIRKSRIDKNIKFNHYVKYGDIQITINLSKPEKDPKAIAAAKNIKSTNYPLCLLCKENVGFAGNMKHPARQNHRIIPLDLADHRYYLQYSPYVYYNEHCIVFNGQHVPMKIDKAAFTKLFDFVKQFPHYFLGSNADLPIVGGSILTHDHFQGGHYEFAMERAAIEKEFVIPGYEDVKAGIVHWPLSVIRIQCKDEKRLIELADYILKKWRGYTDEEAYIFAETDGEPHNTITPIARKKGDMYELDLTLRNNITTKECPLGLYHPHNEYHHIKKENIGLIEVMGLAVLPSRLKAEMEHLGECLVKGEDVSQYEDLKKHAPWVDEIKEKYEDINEENVEDILKEEIGQVFVKVLEDAGVYKCTEEGRKAFDRFIATL